MTQVHAWFLAIRPKTLPAALTPVVLGTAIAKYFGRVALGPAMAALAGALLLQIASNLANDLFDSEKGVDRSDRIGPARVVSSGLIAALDVKVGLGVALFLALCVGAYLVGVAGAVVGIIGLAAALSAVLYTAGPFPLGYHGLGEIFVFVFFGPVAVVGTVFVQLLALPYVGWIAGISLGALAVNILVVNNLRDRTQDERAGKRTLAVRFGERFCVAQYATLLAVAYAMPIALWLSTEMRWFVLAPLASLPVAILVLTQIRRTRGAGLNQLLARTAQLMLLFGVLFAAGLVASS